MPQQPALDVALEALAPRTHEAADVAARRDHAVARDDDRDRVGPARPTHRARGRADLPGELAVGARLAGGDALHRFPYREAMMRAGELQRQVEDQGRGVEV